MTKSLFWVVFLWILLIFQKSISLELRVNTPASLQQTLNASWMVNFGAGLGNQCLWWVSRCVLLKFNSLRNCNLYASNIKPLFMDKLPSWEFPYTLCPTKPFHLLLRILWQPNLFRTENWNVWQNFYHMKSNLLKLISKSIAFRY